MTKLYICERRTSKVIAWDILAAKYQNACGGCLQESCPLLSCSRRSSLRSTMLYNPDSYSAKQINPSPRWMLVLYLEPADSTHILVLRLAVFVSESTANTVSLCRTCKHNMSAFGSVVSKFSTLAEKALTMGCEGPNSCSWSLPKSK